MTDIKIVSKTNIFAINVDDVEYVIDELKEVGATGITSFRNTCADKKRISLYY